MSQIFNNGEDIVSIVTVYEYPQQAVPNDIVLNTTIENAHMNTGDIDIEEKIMKEEVEEEEEIVTPNTLLQTEEAQQQNKQSESGEAQTVVYIPTSSERSSRKTSNLSDTSASTQLSEDSRNGYLRMNCDSSGFHSDYTTAGYKQVEYSQAIENNITTGRQSSIYRQSQRLETAKIIEESDSREHCRISDISTSPLPSSFSSTTLSTFTETAV